MPDRSILGLFGGCKQDDDEFIDNAMLMNPASSEAHTMWLVAFSAM
jgi:hypothetical protein